MIDGKAFDDRMFYFVIRYHPEGPKAEGGWNSFWDTLPKDKKRAAWYAALEALCAAGAQMIGDDALFQEITKRVSQSSTEKQNHG